MIGYYEFTPLAGFEPTALDAQTHHLSTTTTSPPPFRDKKSQNFPRKIWEIKIEAKNVMMSMMSFIPGD